MSRTSAPAGAPPARQSWEFTGLVLVDCPACGGCARVTALGPPESEVPLEYQRLTFGPRRMVCEACAAVREQPQAGLSNTSMGLPLRLRAQTRHGDLFFYNLAHLDYVRAYIADPQRAEAIEPGGPRNSSIFSRLPSWAKRAQARADVLAAIDKARRGL